MDFLGLRTLTVIQDTINLVEKNRGIKVEYDKDMADPKVYKLWQDGNTSGVFQFESQGMTNFMKECNIKLINDESVLINDEFYLVGRRDTDKPGTEDGTRAEISELTKDLDKTKPIFVLSHEPDELQKTADAGADIDFSGHTHDGQLFPGNLTIGLFWENPCGMIKKDNMYSIVTSGVGVYGTFMRVGTDAEICSVDIDFAG